MNRITMPVRCAGCAYTTGTEANRSPETQLLALVCVMTDEPFYCHANAVHDQIPPGDERLCLGFMEALQARGPVQLWQIAIGEEALRMLEEARERQQAGLPELSADDLDDLNDQFWRRIVAAGEHAQRPMLKVPASSGMGDMTQCSSIPASD